MRIARSHRRIMALDFDGVICDSLEEGLLISWFGHTGAPVTAFYECGLAGVPPVTIDRFTRCRPYTRHLGHWLVPFVTDLVPATHAEFSQLYDTLPARRIRIFMDAATAYRTEVRHAHPGRWLAHHRVHPELVDMVPGAYVVTARDVGSVRQILEAHSMSIGEHWIFGSLGDKREALQTIAVREAVAPARVTLVDDSIHNCVAAVTAGFSAWWATWGYHIESDRAIALEHDIPAISIDALLDYAESGGW